jgi:hypothetical protein
MKQICAGFFALLLAFGCSGEKSKCVDIHEGKFAINDPTAQSVIERRGNIQIEQGAGFQTTFDVEWIDDCTYLLKNGKSIGPKQQRQWKPTDELKIEIDEIKDNTIYFTMTANFADVRIENKMQVVD